METQFTPAQPQTEPTPIATPSPPPAPAPQAEPVPVGPMQEPIPMQQSPVQQPPSLSKKPLLIYFALINLILFVVGFGGTWAYSKYVRPKQLNTTFDADAANEAVDAVKKMYPELKDIEEYNEKTNPGTYIRTMKTSYGWKVRFSRKWGLCDKDDGNCEREQHFYFIVDSQGSVTKVNDVDVRFDPDGNEVERRGTLMLDFFGDN